MSFTRTFLADLLAKNILVAVLYFIGGQIGSSLSFYPFYAMIIWPPAGISLGLIYVYGYRILPGVFMGALFLNINLLIVHQPDMVINVAAERVISSFFVALGACAQGFIGVYLLNAVLSKECRFEKLNDIMAFAFLAGPLSSLVSASWSTIFLVSFHVIDTQNALTAWMTWYAGDIVGVLIFTPIAIFFFDQKNNDFHSRRMQIAPPLLCVFGIVAGFVVLSSQYIQNQKDSRFQKDADTILYQIKAETDNYIQTLYALRSFFYASNLVEEHEFLAFASENFKAHQGITAIFWTPVLPREGRQNFEESASQYLDHPFAVSGLAKNGKISQDYLAQQYLPVTYQVHKYQGKDFKGFDVGSVVTYPEVLERDIIDTDIFITKIPSVFSGVWSKGFMAMLPVYAHNGNIDEQQDKKPSSFLIAIFHLDTLLNSLQRQWKSKGIVIEISGFNDQHAPLSNHHSDGDPRFIDLKGYHWPITLRPDPEYLSTAQNAFLFWIILASIAFTFLASTFLMMVTGTVTLVQETVREKTKELQNRSTFLTHIMNNAPDLVFVKDGNLNIIEANQEFLNLYAPEDRKQIIHTKALGQFKPAEIKLFEEQDRKAFTTGYSEVHENITDYLGRTRTFFTRKIRFHDQDGTPYILGIARDVTEVMTVQSQISSIIMTTADGFITVDENGHIETYNHACEKIFGYPAAEMIGMSINFLEPHRRSEKNDVSFFEFIGNVDANGSGREFKARRKDGTVFFIDLAASKVEVGKRVFYSAIVRDITSEKRAADELKRSNQELEDFAYVASHDLKSPLRHMSLGAEFLNRNYADKLDERGQEFVKVIIRSAARMHDLIDSLLTYSSVGRRDMKMDIIALDEVIDDALIMLESKIKEKNAVIKKEHLPNVFGNKILLTQLFQNIIENALKYQKQDITPKIEIVFEEKNGFYWIYISDNGIGIKPEYAEKIFMIFQRLHKNSQYEGTGIGLAICQRIVEFHGGEIFLDTDYQNGSCFVIKLKVV